MDSNQQFVCVFLVMTLCHNCLSMGMFENFALNKSCSMSSQRSESAGCGGAVNGNTSGVYMNDGSNCIHTSSKQNNSWWEVNLGRPYAVHSILVWARNAFERRMVGVAISVDGHECYRFNSTPARITITCTDGVLTGTVIRVSKNATEQQVRGKDHTINICEFQVLSCGDDYWGSDCSKQCGSCSNSEVCDKVTGHCSSCSSGLKPPLCRAGDTKDSRDGIVVVVVGAVVGVLVVLAIAVAVVVFVIKRRRKMFANSTKQGTEDFHENNCERPSEVAVYQNTGLNDTETAETQSLPDRNERPVTTQYSPDDTNDYLEIIPGPVYNQLQSTQDTRDSHFYSALQTLQNS